MNRFPFLRGLIAATHTPFHADGSLNLEAIPAQANRLLASNVQIAFICGTTGESHSLTVSERRAVTRRWGEIARDTPLQVIAHVGHNCQQDAIALAQAAGESGAHGIAALAPSYFKPASVEELIRFFTPIAAAAPDLPFYFYDIPALTGVHFSAIQFLDQASAAIPNLAGIKFTNSDMIQLQECLHFADERFDILYGNDETLLCGFALGVRGAVGSSYNFSAAVSHRIIDAFECGDLAAARQEQLTSIRIIQTLAKHGYLASAKFVMDLLGVPVGPARSPIRAITAGEKQQLESRLKDGDLWQILQSPA